MHDAVMVPLRVHDVRRHFQSVVEVATLSSRANERIPCAPYHQVVTCHNISLHERSRNVHTSIIPTNTET